MERLGAFYFGHIWPLMATFGTLGLLVSFYPPLAIFVATCGYFMGIGHVWPLFVIYGQFFFLAFSGFWDFCVITGFDWARLCVSGQNWA